MNPTVYLWVILQIGVQLGVALLWPDRLGKGRLFSRPLWRFRLFRPYRGYAGTLYASQTRMMQVFLITPIYLGADFMFKEPNWYSPVLIALYLDDYLTGDDDRWKRFWESVRNKVRWRMVLPKPAVNH